MEIEYERVGFNKGKEVFRSIENLISEAWYDEYDFSEKIIRNYSKGYLYIHLAASDFIEVAKKDGEVVGFILGRNSKIPFFRKLKYKLKTMLIFFKLCCSKAGRRGIKIQLKTHKVEKELYKMSKIKTDNELVLFVTRRDLHNYGIGTRLEKDLCDFLKENGRKQVYIYTDTYCNFKFYDSKGYVKKSELEVDFKIKDEEEDPLPKYFLLTKEL